MDKEQIEQIDDTIKNLYSLIGNIVDFDSETEELKRTLDLTEETTNHEVDARLLFVSHILLARSLWNKYVQERLRKVVDHV